MIHPFAFRLLLPVLVILGIGGCLFEGDGNSRPKAKILSGHFVNEKGKPLQGVRVSVVPVKAFRLAKTGVLADSALTKTVQTDIAGRYAFENLPYGEYNLVGEYGDGELAILLPNVRYDEANGLLELGGDTLYAPGRIQGRVLRSGIGQEGVVVYLPGTSLLAVSDANGRFALNGIPRGKYQVNYLVPNLQAKSDTGVLVISRGITLLPDKILTHDPALPPPTPNPPHVTYDAAKGVVRIRWNPIEVEDLLGHLIYRDTGLGSSASLLKPRIITDTEYVDTLPDWIWQFRDTVLVSYRLRSVDTGKNLSINFSIPASILASKRRPMRSSIIGEVWGAMELEKTLSQDTGFVKIWFQNPFLSPLILRFKRDDDPTWNAIDTVFGVEGLYVKPIFFPNMGRIEVRVTAVDSASDTLLIRCPVTVQDARPNVNAGEDFSMSLGDTAHLSGEIRWEFGTIGRREWSLVGSDQILSTDRDDLVYPSTMQPGHLKFVYKAYDIKGRVGVDTVIVEVSADPPTALLRSQVEAFPGDTVRFFADSIIDRFGRIERMEWSTGDGSTFVPTSSPETSMVVGPADSQIVCRLRLTDDDDQSSVIERRVRIAQNKRWIQIEKDAPYSDLEGLFAWEFDGKLWVSESNPVHRYYPDWKPLVLWSTRDLSRWENEAAKLMADTSNTRTPLPIRSNGGTTWGIKLDENGFPTAFATRDGQQWDSVTGPEEFQQGKFSVAQPFNGELVLIGNAENLRFAGEVWKTRGGSYANRVLENAAYGKRYLMPVVEMNGKLWLYGGLLNETIANDVWTSNDGVTWNRITQSALSRPRHMAAMASHQNELWIVGDRNDAQSLQEVWRSVDGANWKIDPIPSPLINGTTVIASLVEFQSRLFLIALRPDRQMVQHAEIWEAP